MVASGQKVIVHLTGRIAEGEDAGEVFETTDVDVALDEGIYHDHRDFKPLQFRVGEGEVLPGIDETVQEMEPGETRTVVLDPEDAYGLRSEEQVVTVSREAIEARSDATAAVGELVRNETGDVGWITEVTAEDVTIDFNHELAGERVEFEIRLLDLHDDRAHDSDCADERIEK